MSSINFDNPWLLLIAIPLLVVIAVPFFLTVRKGNRNKHNVASCILHVFIALTIAFSAAGTTVKSVAMETNVYVVADLSYSAQNRLDEIDEHIRRLEKNLPMNTEMGVVCFGATGSQLVHAPLGQTPKSVRVALEQGNVNGMVGVDKLDTTSTDIVSALEFTGKIFKNGVIKRIVLITDAKATDGSGEAELKQAIDNLYASKVYVDAIYLDSNMPETAQEVQISGVEVADTVYRGQASKANILLQSSVNTRATLRVKRFFEKENEVQETVIFDQPIDVGVGLRSVVVPLETEEEGNFSYAVELVDTAKDGIALNNAWRFAQTVSSKPRTLFIGDLSGNYEGLLEKAYGVNYAETVDLMDITDDIPYTVAALCKYDEIVLSDVNVTDNKNYQTFIQSLETVVSKLGKSLIGMGDLHLQSTTDEYLLRLAGMLPVRYGNPVKDERLYAIIFDMSHSMEFMGRMSMAKSAAKQLVDILAENSNNKVVVVGFHGNAEIIQPITSAADVDTIKEKIDNVETKHGTVINGGIQAAAELLKTYATQMKTQMFFLSDGEQNDSVDWTTAKRTINSLKEDYAVVTTALGIYPSSYEGRLISLVGEENYRAIVDNSSLKEVFADFSNEIGEAVVEGIGYWVEKKQLYDEVMLGVDDKALLPSGQGGGNGYIRGYIASAAKADATTVLTTQYKRMDEVSVTVPIYAYWQYGNGKSAAFLSSFGDKWSEEKGYYNWTDKWENTTWTDEETGDTVSLDQAFFKNVLSVNTPTRRVENSFTAQINRHAGGGTLEVRPAELRAGAVIDVRLTAPDGSVREFPNLALNSNVYTCALPLPSVGEYQVEITYTYKDKSERVNKTVYVSYLAEYDKFTAYDASTLYKVIGSKGTVSEDGNLTVVNDEKEIGVRRVDLTPPLLILAVVLFAADVIVRKVKWADVKGLFRKNQKGGKV